MRIVLITLLLAAPALADDAAVKSIELPHFQPYLPPGPQRELFASACLSCHSTRYITMQPIAPVPKWEENVKKMIKTYGAPLAEDQAAPLAQYLVAMQQAEPDPVARTVVASKPAPRITIETDAAKREADQKRGEAIYATSCASCHGAGGAGDGTGMKDQLPRATDLTSGRFAPEAIAAAVVNGVPATAMPASPKLSADDVRDVVTYTSHLGKDRISRPLTATDEAKKLYAAACASCHGEGGKGDGFNAPTLERPPTNFHVRQPSQQRAIEVISDGVAGTPMTSWKAKFTDEQRKQLAEYVRSFWNGSPQESPLGIPQ
jgi:mono/diheme cytochrome c family protein